MGYDYILFQFPCLEIITTDFIYCPDCVLLSAEISYWADQICCNHWLNFKQTLEQRNNHLFLNAAPSGCDDPKPHHRWYTVPSVSNSYTQTYNLKLRYRLQLGCWDVRWFQSLLVAKCPSDCFIHLSWYGSLVVRRHRKWWFHLWMWSWSLAAFSHSWIKKYQLPCSWSIRGRTSKLVLAD